MSATVLIVLLLVAVAFGAIVGQFLLGHRTRQLQAELEQAKLAMREQQASQAQVMHTTKLASLGQMVAGVAHEINTPLGFVKSNVEVVSDLVAEHESQLTRLLTGVDLFLSADAATIEASRSVLARARAAVAGGGGLTDAKDLLGDAIEGLQSIAALVANLKGFARVDRDGLDWVDLNDSVRSALTVAGHQLRDRVQVRLELAELPKVRCMPSQLNQVLLNLVNNAAQAIEDRGTITVSTRATADAVEVSVADTGAGIPDDVLPKIFDPFFTTKAVGEGTGLGLSIVHKIVKAHGGAIHVRTAVGQGTTFTVSLPQAAKPAAVEKVAA